MKPATRLDIVVALAVLFVALFYSYGRQQFGLGEKAERSAWLKRENDALTRANARIKVLEDDAREKERLHAQDMAGASAKYQEDLKNGKAAKDRVIADLRSGDLRLRVPVTCPGAAGGSDAAAPGSGAAGRDGETRAELSVPASEFLVGLASEADDVVNQLTACQNVVNADRKQQGEQR